MPQKICQRPLALTPIHLHSSFSKKKKIIFTCSYFSIFALSHSQKELSVSLPFFNML